MKKTAVLFGFMALVLSSGLLFQTAVFARADFVDGEIIENPLYVWLIAGQSNAAGYTAGASYPGQREFDDVYYFGIADDQPLSSAVVKNVQFGLGADETKIGPELGMASCVTGNREGKEYAFIKCAYGGTPFSPTAISSDTSAQSYRYGRWTSPSYLADHPTTNSRAGLAYENMLKVVEAGLKAYQELGYTPIVLGIAWMQGEADAWSNISAEVYRELLIDFISDLQSAVNIIGEELSLPQPDYFPLVTALIPKSYALGNAQKIRDGMMSAAEECEWVFTIDNDDLVIGSDGHHYTAASMAQLGKNFGNALLAAQADENSFAAIAYGENISGEMRTLTGIGGNRAEITLRIADGYDFEVVFARPDGSAVDGEAVSFTKAESSFSFTLPQGSVLVTVTAVASKPSEPDPSDPGEPEPNPTPEEPELSDRLPTGAIVAIIVAAVVVIAGVTFMIVRLIKRKDQK